MPDNRPDTEHSTFNLRSMALAVFKHKALAIACALTGLIAAAAFWIFYPPVYASEAKLLVRYVLDRSAVDSLDSNTNSSVRTSSTSENVISSEVEILTSWDLAIQVAEAIGAARLLPEQGNKATVEAAAGTISAGLEVIPRRESNIILVIYKNRRPELTTLVLNELVNRYFNKHLEVHRSAGAFDFVSQQTDQVRARLNQTEDALKALRMKAGIISLNDGNASLSVEMQKLDDQLRVAEGELAEQEARVKELGISVPSATAKTSPSPAANGVAQSSPAADVASSTQVSEYQAIAMRLTQLRQTQLEMLTKYTAENVLVKMNQQHIDELETQKRNLETKFPELTSKITGTTPGAPMDLGAERARLVGVRARVKDLRDYKATLQDRMKQLSEMGPQIAGLERNKELEEANFKYFEGTLEKARVDEALDPSKMPNISTVQRPSPPLKVTKFRNKVSLALAGGGIGLGVALALALDLIFNRSVKQRSELETMLRMPVMVSIPYDASGGRLQLKNGKQNGDPAKPDRAPWDPGHFMRTYSEAIRDRLGLYFELHGVTHKPKLIGVTGFGQGAGTSTLAAGVAAALSETGDGKVLLVDANAASGQAHPFFAGKPAASLTAAIEPAAPITSAADNLYLATVSRPNKNATQLGLKKFFSLVPNLKASDFDYIIFDMPPLTQTSPTIGLAALMDKVLLVVEAEKTNRDVVNRGYRELVGARADVAVVLNKTRSYGPEWLEEGS